MQMLPTRQKNESPAIVYHGFHATFKPHNWLIHGLL